MDALLGIEVPGVETLAGLDDGFPPSFFESYVADQTRRAIAATGDPERVVPWVDVGRLPHDGDPIPPVTIDHVLVDRRIGVVTASTHPMPGSDHRALFATLVLPH